MFKAPALGFVILVWCITCQVLPADEIVSLAGQWRFQLDSEDAGIDQRWYSRALSGKVLLPGVLAAQGIGDDVSVDTRWIGGIVDRSWFTEKRYAPYREPGNVKIPFWLQPDRYYAGPAWFQCEIRVPEKWRGMRILLTLERPHWETRVWLDNKKIGSNNSLSAPHEYDLGTSVSPGEHRLTIRVDNRLVVDVGINSHSISDHTQGNWNGIVGRIELSSGNPVWIDDLQVYPHVATKTVIVKGKIGNVSGRSGQAVVALRAELVRPTGQADSRPMETREVGVAWDGAQGGQFEAEYPLGEEALLWDEFSPALYRLTAFLHPGQSSKSVTFGLREITTRGTELFLNARRLFLRGTLECAIFPETGHPPVELDAWKRIIRTAKAHGLNHFRFHSWCPPEAAFSAADELGFYFQVECGSWANQSTSLGDGEPVDQWLYQEAGRILKAYGNHPSFLLMAYGNEPGGPRHKEYLAKWVDYWKGIDDRRLHTSGSGWPLIPENEFHVTPTPRIQAWGQGLDSRINSLPPETRTDYRDYIQSHTVPVVSHEIGQWCVYPNFDEMRKYTGYLKPKNFEIFLDTLRAHHMGDLAHSFLISSGKLQALCYKEDIESALRTPGMGGFQLLDLHDFPGQGTALIGVLDPFWESKGYITGEEFSRFCNSTVPLARLSKRVFTSNERLEANLEVAHFGPATLEMASATWELVSSDGSIVAHGEQAVRAIAVGNALPLGDINWGLENLPCPQKYKLVVRLTGILPSAGAMKDGLRRTFENDWDIWIYPSKVDITPPPGISLVNDVADLALDSLSEDAKVLLFISPERVKGDQSGNVALGFSSIFWNTAWTRRQAPHTLGLLCDPEHPALAGFPTEFHSNWQWWYLVTRAGAMIMDDLPSSLRPIVQVIDDWFTARRLGLVFEAKLGSRKLLVCSINLRQELEQDPVAPQMLNSLLRYMSSDRFQPTETVSLEEIRNLSAAPE